MWQEDHSYRLSKEELKRYQGQWYLTLNKSGKNAPMSSCSPNEEPSPSRIRRRTCRTHFSPTISEMTPFFLKRFLVELAQTAQKEGSKRVLKKKFEKGLKQKGSIFKFDKRFEKRLQKKSSKKKVKTSNRKMLKKKASNMLKKMLKRFKQGLKNNKKKTKKRLPRKAQKKAQKRQKKARQRLKQKFKKWLEKC